MLIALHGFLAEAHHTMAHSDRSSLPAAVVMQARDLADKALASFIIIQAALRRSRRLHAYSLREDLTRMPGFTCIPLANALYYAPLLPQRPRALSPRRIACILTMTVPAGACTGVGAQ